jgi:hypothetical protein
MPRQGNKIIVLEEARLRVSDAEAKRDSLRVQLTIAQAVYEAEVNAFHSLEEGLASSPRRASVPKSQPVPNAGRKSKQKSSTEPSQVTIGDGTGNVSTVDAIVCAVPNCFQNETARIHERAHPDYHKFHPVIKTKGASTAL